MLMFIQAIFVTYVISWYDTLKSLRKYTYDPRLTLTVMERLWRTVKTVAHISNFMSSLYHEIGHALQIQTS
jgi:hypothetical protein